jgi:hypothetical protein
LEPFEALIPLFGASRRFKTFIWNFWELEHPHLDHSTISNSLFENCWSFQSSVTYMQLQYFCHESFVASELTLTGSSDYGRISRNKFS